MSGKEQNCKKCRKQSAEDAIFCQHCGYKFEAEKNLSVSDGIINHRHVIYTLIIVFMAEMIFSFIAGLGWYIYYPDAMEDIPKLVIVSSIGSLSGVFFGSLFAAYRFAERSRKEVTAGALACVVISKIIDFFVTGSFSIEIITGLLVSSAIAFAGILAGQFIKKRISG